MRCSPRPSAALVAVALVATALAGCGAAPGPGDVARSFVGDVDAMRWPAAAALTAGTSAAELQSAYDGARSALGATRWSSAAGPVKGTGATASVPVTTTVIATGFTSPFTLSGTAELTHASGRWRLAWAPTAIVSALRAGDHLNRTATFATRAPVLGAGGAQLTPAGVAVGLVGSRITDAAQVAALLRAAGFDAGAVSSEVARAAAVPSQLVPVGTITEAAYEAIKASPTPNLHSVGGTAFTSGAQVPLTAELGAHLLGTVGPITAEQLATLGAPYTASSPAGRGGIEAAYERQLAGTPAQTAVVTGADGSVVATLASAPAVPGTPVTTTIDPVVQRAAEGAMAALPATTQAALVVERASTGEVLASVSRPLSAPLDLALDGQVPPGSTFKVVTSADLLEHGSSPSSPATCPATLTVNGQQFKNFEREAAASLTLAQAFAVSCNTAFVGLAASLPAESFGAVAAQFGLGTGTAVKAGVAVAGTSVPAPASPNDQAATAIGQGGVVVSPLAMASVAATVASGSYHPPRIVAGAADDTAAASPLPADVAQQLQTLMAGVVTGSGTAAGAGLPAGTIGKTGTAEFGSGPNPSTHAWFIGAHGDLAFSVFVYGGGVGGTVAAPIAAALLRVLP